MRRWPSIPDWLLVVVACGLVLFFLAIQGCGSIQQEYVEADRAFHDAMDPYVRNWIDSDTLKPKIKEALHMIMDGHDFMIRCAESAYIWSKNDE